MNYQKIPADRILSCVHRLGRRVIVNATALDAVIQGKEPDPKASPEFVSIRQYAERHPGAFTPSAVRQMIDRARIAVQEQAEATPPPERTSPRSSSRPTAA